MKTERIETDLIETERLLIRRFTPDDGQALHAYLSDPQVVRFEPYGVMDEEACKQEAIRRAGDPAFWAVSLKPHGPLIGNLYLAAGEQETWTLGYVFHAGWQGRGYATEAARALVDFAFTQRHAHRVIAFCNPENHPSWRLLERLGMRREGHLRHNIYFRRDAEGHPLWADTYTYAILATEWTGQRTTNAHSV